MMMGVLMVKKKRGSQKGYPEEMSKLTIEFICTRQKPFNELVKITEFLNQLFRTMSQAYQVPRRKVNNRTLGRMLRIN